MQKIKLILYFVIFCVNAVLQIRASMKKTQEVFVNQKRVNVCEYTVKMSSNIHSPSSDWQKTYENVKISLFILVRAIHFLEWTLKR